MQIRSEKSQHLFNLLMEKGLPEVFCEEICKNLNTDFTAQMMLGYFRNVPDPTVEMIVDEMLAILDLRKRIIEKKIAQHSTKVWNIYLNDEESE